MGRGVSSGGGQSSLGYLFGGGEPSKPAASNNNASAAPAEVTVKNAEVAKPVPASQPVDVAKQIPAGSNRSATNNYFRADGQNCGNFITDRPTVKVHAAPGGDSSLDYLFGGSRK